jgi:hypothetical protein
LKTLINQAGKALSGWTSEIGGGVPPTLSSIQSSQELVNDFVLALFGDDIKQRWPESIRNMLIATLLRHYEDFIIIIEQHPKELYEDNSSHPMVHSVNKALRLAKVDHETLSFWCKEVHEGFCTNNYMALPIECCLSPDAARVTKIDPQSLYDWFNQLCNSYNSLFAQKMNLEDDISQLCLDVANLTCSNHRLEKAAANQTEILARVVNVLEIKFDKQVNKPAPCPPTEDVMLFSDSMKRWRKDFSVKEQFVRYFVDQCHRGYKLKKNSAGFKKKLPSKKTKIKNQYKRLKRSIKVMLYFCDFFPKPAPRDSSSLVTWQRGFSALAEQASNALKDALPNPPIHITQAYLFKSEIVKDWDNPDSPLAKQSPKGTPNVILAHFGFNSNA